MRFQAAWLFPPLSAGRTGRQSRLLRGPCGFLLVLNVHVKKPCGGFPRRPSRYYNQPAPLRTLMQALSPASSLLQPPVSLLEKTPAILEMLLRDVPAETLDWKPAAERWSITEVLSHLLAIEQLYVNRPKRIVVVQNPMLAKFAPPT